MANNRLYLVCRVTGRALGLGKRMSTGYYDAPQGNDLQRFFDHAETDMIKHMVSFDDFILVADHQDTPYVWGCAALPYQDGDAWFFEVSLLLPPLMADHPKHPDNPNYDPSEDC